MLKYLFDTNACINYIKFPDSRIRQRLESITSAEVAVCSIVKFEMFYGSLRSTNPERSLRIQQQFFSQFESLPFDDNSARIAARIRAELAAAGRIIGAYDILISSIVIANDLIRVTHNLSEFSRVSGLKIEDWEV